MKDFLNWCIENEGLLKDILRLILTAASFLYATIIHLKSKKRLGALETKEEIKEDLVKTIDNLKSALERSKK